MCAQESVLFNGKDCAVMRVQRSKICLLDKHGPLLLQVSDGFPICLNFQQLRTTVDLVDHFKSFQIKEHQGWVRELVRQMDFVIILTIFLKLDRRPIHPVALKHEAGHAAYAYQVRIWSLVLLVEWSQNKVVQVLGGQMIQGAQISNHLCILLNAFSLLIIYLQLAANDLKLIIFIALVMEEEKPLVIALGTLEDHHLNWDAFVD